MTKFSNLWHCSAVLAGLVSFIFLESELQHSDMKYFCRGVSGLSLSDFQKKIMWYVNRKENLVDISYLLLYNERQKYDEKIGEVELCRIVL